MSNERYDGAGQICRVNSPAGHASTSPQEVRYTLSLPAATESDAIAFLQGLGGDAAGAGVAMRRVGVNAPIVRAQYKREVETLARQVAKRLEQGQSVDDVARWASEQRRQIVQRMRAGSGPVTRAYYEIRDWRRYGRGGRTYANMVRHYQRRDVPQSKISTRILDGAQRSNIDVDKAIKGASYLRHGGRVLIAVGVAVSEARIWNASDNDLPRVIGEELGGLIGGGLGAGAGVTICLIFGIGTGGWGLLACGVVGGLTGGVGGSMIGGSATDAIFYSDVSTPDHLMGQVVVEVPASQVYTAPPPAMCIAPR